MRRGTLHLLNMSIVKATDHAWLLDGFFGLLLNIGNWLSSLLTRNIIVYELLMLINEQVFRGSFNILSRGCEITASNPSVDGTLTIIPLSRHHFLVWCSLSALTLARAILATALNSLSHQTMLRKSFFIELEDMSHASLDLAHLLSGHEHELSGPFFLYSKHFPCSQNYTTSEVECFIL